MLAPAAFLLLIFVFLLHGNASPALAMALYFFSTLIAFVFGAYSLHLGLKKIGQAASPSYLYGSWFKSIMPLSLIAGVQVISSQTDIIMLGILRSDGEVGVYKVALAMSSIVVFFRSAVSSVVSPMFAKTHAAGDFEKLNALVKGSTRFVVITSLPVALVLTIFGQTILGKIFGADYKDGFYPLLIMCIGQLIYGGMGLVAELLNMTGNERDTLRGVSLSALLNVLLNLVLIPRYGAVGAAVASACSLIFWGVFLARIVRYRLGVKISLI